MVVVVVVAAASPAPPPSPPPPRRGRAATPAPPPSAATIARHASARIRAVGTKPGGTTIGAPASDSLRVSQVLFLQPVVRPYATSNRLASTLWVRCM